MTNSVRIRFASGGSFSRTVFSLSTELGSRVAAGILSVLTPFLICFVGSSSGRLMLLALNSSFSSRRPTSLLYRSRSGDYFLSSKKPPSCSDPCLVWRFTGTKLGNGSFLYFSLSVHLFNGYISTSSGGRRSFKVWFVFDLKISKT